MKTITRDGLTSQGAAQLLAANGTNSIPAQHNTPWWRRFATNLMRFFALLFWIPGALAFTTRTSRQPVVWLASSSKLRRFRDGRLLGQ